MVATTPRSAGQQEITIFFPKKEQRALAKRKKALAKAKSCKLPPKLKTVMDDFKECFRSTSMDWKDWRECKDEMETKFTKLGVKSIGRGAQREAYAFNGCVVKVPTGAGSIEEGNMREADTYDLIPPALKKFVVPIIDMDDDYYWLTMPKVEIPDYGKDDCVRQLKDEFLKRGEYMYDVHSANVGIYNNECVVLDYGFGLSGNPSAHSSSYGEGGDERGPNSIFAESPTHSSEIHRRAQEEIERMKNDFAGFQRHFPGLDFGNVVKVNSHELIYEAPGEGLQVMNMRPGQASQEARDSHDARIERENEERIRIMKQQKQNFIDQFPEVAQLDDWHFNIINRREAIYRTDGQAPRVFELRDIPATEISDVKWESYVKRFPELAGADRRQVFYIPYENPHELQWDKPGDIPRIFILHRTESINRVRMENGLPPE